MRCDTPTSSSKSPDSRPRRRRTLAAGVAVAIAVGGVGLADAGGVAPLSTAPAPPIVAAPDRAAAAVLAAARAHVGDVYVYGGIGPKTWDCSGLTSTLWRTVGGVASIPRTAAEQQAWATPVPPDQARPGDLVFFDTPASHVALYEGDGWIVDASASQKHIVERPIWTTAATFGRVPRPTAPRVRPEAGFPPAAPKPAHTTAAPVTRSTTVAAPERVDPVSAHFLADARKRVGARYAIGGTGPAAYDDGALIAKMWHAAVGKTLPLGRAALAASAAPITRSQLRPGDLLIYGHADVWHVAIYAGSGTMIDASRSLGHVVSRPVLASGDLHYGRLPRR